MPYILKPYGHKIGTAKMCKSIYAKIVANMTNSKESNLQGLRLKSRGLMYSLGSNFSKIKLYDRNFLGKKIS